MLLIPSIDLRNGQCVRLLRGDFAAETRYDVDPVMLLQRYQSLGAPWLHVVDLDGARDGELGNLPILQQLAASSSLRLQVGGGVRTLAAALRLRDAGVSRVVIGSAAIEHPSEVLRWVKELGPEACCLALDVRLDSEQIPRVQTRGWTQGTQVSLWDALAPFRDVGVKDVLCTDVARDGALEGPSDSLYREALHRYPDIDWQASGGVRDGADLQALHGLGLASAISGKALLEGRIEDEALRYWFRGGRD